MPPPYQNADQLRRQALAGVQPQQDWGAVLQQMNGLPPGTTFAPGEGYQPPPAGTPTPTPPPGDGTPPAVSEPPPPAAGGKPHRLTIMNGPNVSMTDYSPAGQGMTGRAVADAADPDVARYMQAGVPVEGVNAPAWQDPRTAGPVKPGMGMDFNTMRNMVGSDIRYLPEVMQMWNAQENRRAAEEAQRQQMGLEREKIAVASDPVKAMRQSAAAGLAKIFEQGGPGATNQAQQFLQALNQAMESQTFQRAMGLPGTPQAAGQALPQLAPQPGGGGVTAPPGPTGAAAPGRLPPQSMAAAQPSAQPRNIYDQQSQRETLYGPQIAAAIGEAAGPGNAFPTPTSKLLTDIYLYDQQHPGFMQQHGQRLLEEVRQARGAAAPEEFAAPTTSAMTLSGVANLFRNDYTPQDKAAAAMRHYLGMGKPAGLGMGFLANDPHAGIPALPGSPALAAQLEALRKGALAGGGPSTPRVRIK